MVSITLEKALTNLTCELCNYQGRFAFSQTFMFEVSKNLAAERYFEKTNLFPHEFSTESEQHNQIKSEKQDASKHGRKEWHFPSF